MNKNHWINHAAKWNRLGPPLRPHDQDVSNFTSIMEAVAKNKNKPRHLNALILGVTNELVNLPWPRNTTLFAAEKMIKVIELIWSPNTNIISNVVNADWLELPFPDNRFDLVLGDGCTSFFAATDQLNTFARSVGQKLKPDATLALRCFLRPEIRETVDSIMHDLVTGKSTNTNAIKWRLSAALQEDATKGVTSFKVWDVYNSFNLDKKKLCEQFGMSLDEFYTLDSFKESSVIYYFHSLDEIKNEFGHSFEFEKCYYGNYELAERCPIVQFRKIDQ